jgi:iron complex transport system substrate-binding protein
MEMDAFAGGKAVEDGKVYLYESELGNTPRIIVGIAYWAKWFHPELFSDLDPKVIHQEYLTDFLGIDYDLDEHGVFVYPEP